MLNFALHKKMMHRNAISCIRLSVTDFRQFTTRVGNRIMANEDLVRFLSDSAAELLGKAENAAPVAGAEFLDEAEELLALGASVLNRPAVADIKTLEAA